MFKLSINSSFSFPFYPLLCLDYYSILNVLPIIYFQYSFIGVFTFFFSVSSHFFLCNRTSRFDLIKYNFDKLYASEINLMQKYLFLMIYVYFFLRSL